MKSLLIILLSVSALCAQLEIYTNIDNNNKNIQKDQFFQISLDIIKQMQKTLGTKNTIKVFPSSKYNKKKKNTIFIGTPDSFTKENFKPLNIITSENYTLYGNRYEIYYIDTLEDAKSAKKIYCKKCQIAKDVFENNSFYNISYINKQQTGLKNLLKSKERLWLISNWKIKNIAKKEYKKLKPVHTITTKENYLMLPSDIDEETFQAWKQSLITLKTNGTLEKIVNKWEKKLNLNLELKSNGAIAVVD